MTSMLINPYRFSGASVTYLDDLATLPQAVWSFRKMISTATTAIRVRRSSDSTEQDIGFSGDDLDTASLASFVGANSAFITIYYDQTGNGENLFQTTASKQPRIYNAGVFDGFGRFDASDDGMSVTSLVLGAPQLGVYTKSNLRGSAGVQVICELTTVASSNNGTALIYDNAGNNLADSYNSSGQGKAKQYTGTPLTYTYWTYLFNRALTGDDEILAYATGALRSGTIVGSNIEQTGNYLTNDFYVGSRANSSFFSQLNLETLVIYSADTASIRSSIEAIIA